MRARLAHLLVDHDDIAHLLLQPPKLVFKVFYLILQHLDALFTLFNYALEFLNALLSFF